MDVPKIGLMNENAVAKIISGACGSLSSERVGSMSGAAAYAMMWSALSSMEDGGTHGGKMNYGTSNGSKVDGDEVCAMTGGLASSMTGSMVGSMSSSSAGVMNGIDKGSMTGTTVPTGAVPTIRTVSGSIINLTVQYNFDPRK